MLGLHTVDTCILLLFAICNICDVPLIIGGQALDAPAKTFFCMHMSINMVGFCISVYVCVYLLICSYMFIYVHANACICTYLCMHVYVYLCIYLFRQLRICCTTWHMHKHHHVLIYLCTGTRSCILKTWGVFVYVACSVHQIVEHILGNRQKSKVWFLFWMNTYIDILFIAF